MCCPVSSHISWRRWGEGKNGFKLNATSEGLQIWKPAGGLSRNYLCRCPLAFPDTQPKPFSREGRKVASVPKLSLPGTNAVIRIAAGRLSSLTFPHTRNSMNLHSWGCLTAKSKGKVQLEIPIRRAHFLVVQTQFRHSPNNGSSVGLFALMPSPILDSLQYKTRLTFHILCLVISGNSF